MSKVTVVNIETLGKFLDLKKEMIYLHLNVNNRAIDASNMDFSGITVVLGKNGGFSSKVVDKISSKLEVLGINYYVSDIDKLTPAILQQAASENPNDKILAIRVGGEQNFLRDVSIINDTHNAIDSELDTKNSDSLALMLNSSIEQSTLVSGKRDINSKYPLRVNTDLARFVNRNKFNNPMVKNVTVAISDRADFDLNKLSDSIVCGIVKFCCLSNEEQNKSYLGLNSKDDFNGELAFFEPKPLQCGFRVTLPAVNEKVH